MTVNLATLRATAEAARLHHENLVPQLFLGADHWDWTRACAAISGENVRRNDDQSRDAAMAADPDIRASWDDYITKLHIFYKARDGERGFLGGRGV